jgi:hypothetical protein
MATQILSLTFFMKLTAVILLLLIGCESAEHKKMKEKARHEMIEGINDIASHKNKSIDSEIFTNSKFNNPDTSLSNINLRDSRSSIAIIGEKDKIDDNEEYHYYSTMYRETLTLTQHPGDGRYSISIFKVENSDKADHGYRKLEIDTFKTEKGIKLGITKKEVIEKLGVSYFSKDSSKNSIELYYRLETPHDSKTKILESNNMPIYYASYRFWKDKLSSFEFGFEYP